MRLGASARARGSAAIAALSVVLRIGVLLNRRIDPDESQHLHVAWLITQGRSRTAISGSTTFRSSTTPWRPDAVALREPAVYFAARGMVVPSRPLAVWPTWRLARRLSADGAVWAASPRAGPSVRGDVDGDASRRARARGPPGGRAGAGRLARERPDVVALGLGCRAWPWDCRSRRSSRSRVLALVVAPVPSAAPREEAASSPRPVSGGMGLVLGALFAGWVLFTGVDTLHGLYRDGWTRFASSTSERPAGVRKRDRRVPGRGALGLGSSCA
jgi:hypothetical protein